VVLVDSSVWIALLRRQRTSRTGALQVLLRDRKAALSPLIYQEILQGASSRDHFDRLRTYFSTQPILVPRHPVASHEEAASIYAACRWGGFTPRSPSDCFVAQTAIEHEVDLLAHDRDFDAIVRIDGRLRLYPHVARIGS
jgi:hypothetical protein